MSDSTVLAYWIGYTDDGRRAALYYANSSSSATIWRWWVWRHRRRLVPGVAVGIRNMGSTY